MVKIVARFGRVNAGKEPDAIAHRDHYFAFGIIIAEKGGIGDGDLGEQAA